jgi:hypothetical protein
MMEIIKDYGLDVTQCEAVLLTVRPLLTGGLLVRVQPEEPFS